MVALKRSIGALCALSVMSITVAQEAKKAPNFTAIDADGKSHSLAEHKGKVVVLEWTNPGSPVSGKEGCPFVVPRVEHKIMQNLADKVTADGAVYMAINSHSYNTAADSKAIDDKYNLPYPTLLDSSGAIARAYEAKSTPHMFVIGKDGNIVYDGALNDNATPDVSKDTAAKNYVALAVKAALKGEMPETRKTKSYGCGLKLKE